MKQLAIRATPSRPVVRVERSTCALCDCSLTKAMRSCPRCHRSYHLPCWSLAGGCPTCGWAVAIPSRVSSAQARRRWWLSSRLLLVSLGTCFGLGWLLLWLLSTHSIPYLLMKSVPGVMEGLVAVFECFAFVKQMVYGALALVFLSLLVNWQATRRLGAVQNRTPLRLRPAESGDLAVLTLPLFERCLLWLFRGAALFLALHFLCYGIAWYCQTPVKTFCACCMAVNLRAVPLFPILGAVFLGLVWIGWKRHVHFLENVEPRSTLFSPPSLGLSPSAHQERLGALTLSK